MSVKTKRHKKLLYMYKNGVEMFFYIPIMSQTCQFTQIL